MPEALESHLALLEREAASSAEVSPAERTRGLEDLVALHLALFEAFERRLGPDGVNEDHRPLVPLFRRWLATARRFAASAAELRRQGHTPARLDDLMWAINRAKLVAEDFDHVVALNQRIARGEAGTYRPLSEVEDELRSEP
jgi:hypothetical protein